MREELLKEIKRKNEKIDNLSSDNKRLRTERDNAEDTLHKEQRALRDSQQRADEKLSNMELLLATKDTALKMQERATEQLEDENTKLYEKCRILRNVARELESTMKSREKRAVMRLIDDLAAVAKRKYDDIGGAAGAEDSEDRPVPRHSAASTASSSAETLPMLPSQPRQDFPTPLGAPAAIAPTSPPAQVPVVAVLDVHDASGDSYSESDTERPADAPETADVVGAELAVAPSPAAEASQTTGPGELTI